MIVKKRTDTILEVDLTVADVMNLAEGDSVMVKIYLPRRYVDGPSMDSGQQQCLIDTIVSPEKVGRLKNLAESYPKEA